ncbi:response regulator transcription factor [Methylomonas rivi]|uniref:Response regulator n=1 Tax=Methylomonas rivi TaxID=2952226 RepID=A0ABT1U541_9GAMM|nr:response regulator [Methylomonas sp. WSC-6]MBS4052027.1 response regulator transcription factor [Methylomonas sp.]MCQ8128969.1 response regulator [Methylomonas sp. WSC-6]
MNRTGPAARVFIIDDDAGIRDALSLMLETEGFSVVAFDSANAFLAAVTPDDIGCAIIDIQMPGMDGLQLQQAMMEREFSLPIIFLTGHGDIPKSVRAIKAGALDFLTKPITQKKLLASVDDALQVACLRHTQLERRHEIEGRVRTLTNRERQIMSLILAGHTSKDSARLLGISHRTVEIHRSRLMEKMGVANALDLARVAHECGLAVNAGDAEASGSF